MGRVLAPKVHADCPEHYLIFVCHVKYCIGYLQKEAISPKARCTVITCYQNQGGPGTLQLHKHAAWPLVQATELEFFISVVQVQVFFMR